MKTIVFTIYQLVLILDYACLYSQNLYTVRNTAVYHLLSIDHSSPRVLFAGMNDTIQFDVARKIEKSEGPTQILNIVDSRNRSYSVSSFFSGFGYFISSSPDNSDLVLFRDIPYGELIVNLPKRGQVQKLNVDRLDCVVSINGVRGVPTLDMGSKTIDTEKLKKNSIEEISISNNGSDKIFCSATKRNLKDGSTICTIKFNEKNSPELNEHFEISILFIFWLYNKLEK